jgi:hypothetical protein
VLRACEKPLPDAQPAPACPSNCSDRDTFGGYLDCASYYSPATMEDCLHCVDTQAQRCGQEHGCDAQIAALRCCMESCPVNQGYHECRNTCGQYTAAYDTCLEAAGCFAATQADQPVSHCFP